MSFDAWFANYLNHNKSWVKKQKFTIIQLSLIHNLLKAAFKAGESHNKSFTESNHE